MRNIVYSLLAVLLICSVSVFAAWGDVATEEDIPAEEAVEESVEDAVDSGEGETADVVEEAAESVEVPAEPVPPPLDVNTLKFNKEITGFNYKSSAVDIPALQSRLKSVLDAVIPLIRKIPEGQGYKVQVIGHADGSGPEYPEDDKLGNREWSRRRAQAVVDYMVKTYGLSSGLFEVSGVGSSQLKDSANPKSASNRRVVVKFAP